MLETGMVATALTLWCAAAAPVANIGVGNALTLPAQRHMVHVQHPDGSEMLLLALQQDTAGPGLGFFRSDDRGETWMYEDSIQPDSSHRDTADLLTWGRDVALVYSYEGPTLGASSRHDVWFQWWHYDALTRRLRPSVPVLVFDAGPNEAYYRAEIVRDSLDRLWVQAFHLRADGRHVAELKVSVNAGDSFQSLAPLADLPRRAGGRLAALDGSLVFIYDQHDDLGPALFRQRRDGDPLGSWTAPAQAFSDGIYHGAALSWAPAGPGQLHLVYRSELDEMLWYRFFNGSSFGPRVLVDNTTDWAMQPATTVRGGDLFIFYNRVRVPNEAYDIYARMLRNGALSTPELLDSENAFKGYPAALEETPAAWPAVPCAFGFTANASVGGEARIVSVDAPAPTSPAPSPTPPPPAPADAGVPTPIPAPAVPAVDVLLFSDAFARTQPSLGSAWTVTGQWYADGRAVTDLDTSDFAYAPSAACVDCRVEARILGFGVQEVGVVARARPQSPSDRYELVLLSNRSVRIRKRVSGSLVTLGEAPSGLGTLSDFARLQLVVQGTGPVALTALVNGSPKLTAQDSAPGTLAQAGHGGLWTTRAGVVFDDFFLWQLAGPGMPDAGAPPPVPSPPQPAPAPDAGTPIAPDAGTPAGGAPDAGSPPRPPDAGTTPRPPDAGAPPSVPDAGTTPRPPDAGAPPSAPDAGAPSTPAPSPTGSWTTAFSDAFTRTSSASLGASWNQLSGLWATDGRAVSDLDGSNQAQVAGMTCAECRVTGRLLGFGVSEIGLFARAAVGAPQDRYDVVLRADRTLQLRRFRSGQVTVLATGASGLTSLSDWSQVQLTVSGSSAVSLSAAVNGVVKVSAQDSSASRLGGAGGAGLWTTSAGVVFDDFLLESRDGGLPTPAPAPAPNPTPGPNPTPTPTPSPSSSLSLETALQNTAFDFLAVGTDGTAYAVRLGESRTRLYASADNARSWTLRATHQSAFQIMSSLADGTLIADVVRSGRHFLSRSGDRGATWQDVLDLGDFRMLTPHSVAELSGTAYFLEYQTFAQTDTPIRLWASADSGRTWSVRFTFQGHRHGHGVRADASRGALWALFGDTTPQSGVFRSVDGGRTWVKMLGNQQGDVVDAVVTPQGLLFGQDISYLPDLPFIAALSFDGAYSPRMRIPGPAYSSFGLSQGGYVVGAAREPGGDIYPAGEVSAHVFVSADGSSWAEAFSFPRANANDNVRADVYWELRSGELVLQLYNAQGFGAGGVGYRLLTPVRR